MKPVITFKVKDIFSGKVGGSGIYVFRDGKTVLYIGKAEQDLYARLMKHLGRYGEQSRIGQLIQVNSPESHEWSIDVYWNEHLSQLEFDLIQKLTPALNEQMNGKPHRLPSKYKTEITNKRFNAAKAVAARIK